MITILKNKKIVSILVLITFVLLATSIVSATDNSDDTASTVADTQTSTYVDTSSDTSDTSTTTSTSSNSYSSGDTSTTTNTNTQTNSDSSTTTCSNTYSSSDTTSSKSDTSTTSLQTSNQDKNTTSNINTQKTTTNTNTTNEKTNLKTATNTTRTANSYNDLVNSVDDIKTSAASNETYTILLGDGNTEETYLITSTISWSDSTSGVNNLIIDGQNKVTLDGQGSNRFIYISRGYTLTLQNIIIKNCYSIDGGAIYSNGTLTIKNSTLTNNLAYGTSTYNGGGAIYNRGGNLTITDSKFIENSAYYDGGAIYNSGNLTITNSNITKNYANADGAIRISGNATITNTTFTENTASYGGVIYYTRSKIVIKDSEFIQNTAYKNYGGAIYGGYSNSTITNTTFIDNKASNLNDPSSEHAGAIYFENGNSTIKNSTFINNSARLGGAICFFQGNANMDNVNFYNNSATKFGGAIVSQDRAKIKLNNSIFINNTSNGDSGAIELSTSDMNITNSYFSQNSAIDYGGAVSMIYGEVIHGTLNITNTTFTNNAAGYGGALFNNNLLFSTNNTITNNTAIEGGGIYNNKSATITNTTITNNSATNGGAIYSAYVSLYVQNTTIANNTANQYGGAIYDMWNMTLTNTSFINNTAGNVGGAIYHVRNEAHNGDVALKIINNYFKDNTGLYNITFYTNVTKLSTFRGNIFETVTYNITQGTSLKINSPMTSTRNPDVVTAKMITPSNEEISVKVTTDSETYEKYIEYKFNETGTYTLDFMYNDTTLNQMQFKINVIADTVKYETNITVDNIKASQSDKVNLTAHIVDENGKSVNEGKVAFKINDVTLKDANGDVFYANVVNGTARLEYTVTNSPKNYTITGLYYGTDNYYNSKSEYATLTVENVLLKTTIKVSDMTVEKGQTAQITATVTDSNGNKVTGGKVAFKLNGVTIKDANGDVIYGQVVNGTATIQYIVTNNVKNYTLTATYSGSSTLESSKSNEAILTVISSSQLKITVDPVTHVKSTDTVTLKATVTDNGTKVDNGVVIFKLNGVTIKDENGDSIKATVVNGVATLDYKIPVDMSAKDYQITAVYSNNDNDRVEANNTLTVDRSEVTSLITPLTTTHGQNTTIKTTLYDENGNQLERSTKVAIKINGKTVVHTTTDKGQLNIEIPTDTLSRGDYKIDVVFGENSAYYELRLNTTMTII